MVMNVADLDNLMREYGIMPTRQRQSIAAVLLARPQHLSADQVLDAVRRQGGRVSKATIYNTLGLFARKGLIREVIVDASRVFYDSTIHPHHHVYNVDTGALQDLDCDCVGVDSLPPLPNGTVFDGIDVVIKVRSAGHNAS